MIIGITPNPVEHPHWPQIRAYLEPAAKRGGVPVLEQHEEVWTAYEDGDLIGAATARILPSELIGEVVLVGGKDREKWIKGLNWLLGCWFRMEGMKRMRAYGRKGWKRELEAMGWKVIGEEQNVVAYERAL